MEAGNHPSFMLTANHRQHGEFGMFFSRQFYDGRISFKGRKNRFDPLDLAAIKWMKSLTDKTDFKGNSLMINMNTFERCEARSFSNVGNVNFVLTKIVDLLADDKFASTGKGGTDGKVMIIAPCDAQRNLYTLELQKRSTQEMNSKGDFVPFDKSRVEIRTHQGAQGHEASVVIIDLTRSDSPGMTGESQLVNVCSSRAVCAQVVLINKSMLNHVKSKNAPAVRNLLAWVEFHETRGMLIEI